MEVITVSVTLYSKPSLFVDLIVVNQYPTVTLRKFCNKDIKRFTSFTKDYYHVFYTTNHVMKSEFSVYSISRIIVQDFHWSWGDTDK